MEIKPQQKIFLLYQKKGLFGADTLEILTLNNYSNNYKFLLYLT